MYKWTFMVYMAGDNGRIFDDGIQLMDNLVGYGWNDIKEMSEVGSTDDVAVVVQYDTLDASEIPRLFIDGKSETGTVVEKVSPVNTGDPKNLTDFIVWAETTYPAEKYALILWNHGTGWKEDDIYARYREVEEAVRRDNLNRGPLRRRMLKRALFLPTAAQIMGIQDDQVRAICYDDTSMDFLDNQDLVNALRDAGCSSRNRLALFGMDACMMSMIEVAYQLHEYADYMIGSQEVEEGTGWPYGGILKKLVDLPDMTALDLSRLIVGEFGQYYTSSRRDGGGINTQSAIDLRRIPQTFAQVKAFADLAAEIYPSDFKTEIAVTRAKHDAQCFEDEDFLDLRHLMQCIGAEYDGQLEIGDLAKEVAQHLSPKTNTSPIVANFCGSGRPNANGLSIYFPAKRYSPFYDTQAFTLSGWNKVIRRANRLELPKISLVSRQREGSEAVRSVSVHRTIVCPICWGQMDLPDNIDEIGDTVATKGVRDSTAQIISAIQQALASPITEANQWRDIPCLHCHHTFQYNVKTGETRK